MTPKESDAERTRRLWLEEQCAATARRLHETILKGLEFTLLFFDLGEQGHVAFFTSLTRPELIESFSLLVESWKGKRPRVGFIKRGERQLFRTEVVACGAAVQPPPGVGYALLIGKGELTNYIAYGDREGVREMLETELLPNWKRELQ